MNRDVWTISFTWFIIPVRVFGKKIPGKKAPEEKAPY